MNIWASLANSDVYIAVAEVHAEFCFVHKRPYIACQRVMGEPLHL